MKKSIFITVLTLCMAAAGFHVNAQETAGTEQYPVFKDSIVNGWYNGSKVCSLNEWYGDETGVVPEGQKACLFSVYGGGTKGTPAKVLSVYGAMPCVDIDNAALQLWVYPYRCADSLKIGLTCWGMTGDVFINNFCGQYVSAEEYMDLSENGIGKWQLVTIPLSRLRDEGQFDKCEDTLMTEFDWYRISGFYFSVDNEGLSDNYNVAAFDDIKIINYLNEPQNIVTAGSSNGVRISWDLPPQADGCLVYKNGVQIGQTDRSEPFFCGTEGEYELQTFGGNGMYSNKVKIAAYNTDNPMMPDGEESDITNAKMVTDNTKNVFIWDKNEIYKYYYIFYGNQAIAKTNGNSAELSCDSIAQITQKWEMNVTGTGTPGEKVTLCLSDINGIGSVPYFSQCTVDQNGKYGFRFLFSADPDSYNLKINVGGELAADDNLADTKAEGYSKVNGNISYSLTAPNEKSYKICGVKEDGTISGAVNVETVEKNISLMDYAYIGADKSETKVCYDLNVVKGIRTVICNDGFSRNAVLIAAVYNEDQCLCEMYSEDIYLAAGKKDYIFDTGIIPSVYDNCSIKLFLIDSYSGMFPLAGNISASEMRTADENCSVTVLPEEYQTIKGWGVELALPGSDNDELKNWNSFKTAFFDKLGITITRVFLGTEIIIDGKPSEYKAGDPPVDISQIRDAVQSGAIDTDTIDKSIPIIQCAVDNGIEDYLISVSSPPAAMIEYKDVTEWISRYYLREDCIDLFCDVLLQELDYITNTKGLPAPKAISLQNEPENGLSVSTPQYDVTMYKNTLIALRKKLNENGYENIMLIGPETSSYAGLWTSTGDIEEEHRIWIDKQNGISVGTAFTELDDEYVQNLDAIAVHSYLLPIMNDESFKQYADVPEILAGKDKWQTEFSISDYVKPSETYEMDTAKKEFQVLCADVGWAGNNVWMHWAGHYWALVPTADRTVPVTYLPDDDGNLRYDTQTLGYGRASADKFYTNKTFDMLSMIFKNVPLGSVVKRVKIESDGEGIKNECSYLTDAVAFENGETNTIAFVNDSERYMRFDFKDLKGTSADIYIVMDGVDYFKKIKSAQVKDGRLTGINVPPDCIMLIKTK